MKKIIICCLFIINLYNTTFSNNFEIMPLVIDFRGVEAKQDTIIAFGDYGSMLISYDNAVNWNQVRVFERGTILNLDWNDGNMVAFNDAGDVAVSNDKGNKWSLISNIGDSILTVINYPEGYFIRARNNLLNIDKNFTKNKEFPFVF